MQLSQFKKLTTLLYFRTILLLSLNLCICVTIGLFICFVPSPAQTWIHTWQQQEDTRIHILLASYLLGCVSGGFIIGRIHQRFSFLEFPLSLLVGTLVLFLLGEYGFYLPWFSAPHFTQSLHLSGQPHNLSLADAYMGPLWRRHLSLWALIGCMQGLIAQSLSYMWRLPLRRQTQAHRFFEYFIGLRYLKAKSRDAKVSQTALIAATGVALGVAALIAVLSAMSGYQNEVKEKLLQTNAHMIVQKWTRDFEEYDETRQKITQVPGIVAASPFVFTGGMLSATQGMHAVLIKGIDPDLAPLVSDIAKQLQQISISTLRPPAAGQLPPMIMGHELVKKLNLTPGDEISLVSPISAEGQRGGAPKRMRFKYVGEFKSGMNEFDQKLVYIGLPSAQQFIGSERSVTGIEVKINNFDQVTEKTKDILQQIGQENGWPYRIIDWKQLNQGIFSALKMQKMLMSSILIFIIIVAAFNIASTLLMLVVEKTKEVAILKSMGATDAMIMKIFVLEGHFIALFGIACGVILGFILCFILSKLKIHIAADVYLIDTLRVQINPYEVLFITFFAIEIAHLATLYPALTAARKTPMDAIKYGI